MGEALPGKEIGTEDATVTDTGRVIFTLLVSDLFFAILNEYYYFFFIIGPCLIVFYLWICC